MSRALFFVAGAGVGYVLGTRAGREQYERIKVQAQKFLDQPEVKEVTDAVRAEATRLYDEGRRAVQDALREEPSNRISDTPASGPAAT
jgi:hypothetical protein